MSKNLKVYEVTISKTIYVASETEPDYNDAFDMEEYARDDGTDWEIDAHEVKHTDHLSSDITNSIPWGDHNTDKTVGEFVKEAKESDG